MRSVLEREEALSGQLHKAIFDPKMTRSKVKNVLEKGQVDLNIHNATNIGIHVDIPCTKYMQCMRHGDYFTRNEQVMFTYITK